MDGVSGADDDDFATKMMNTDMQMVPVEPDIGTSCPKVVIEADTEEDGTIIPDGGGDGGRTPSACKFFVGFDVNQAHPDGVVEQVVEDAAEDHHQGTETDGDTVNCACLGNLDDVEHEQVPEPADDCNEEENLDLIEGQYVDGSSPNVVEVDDQNMFPAHEICSDDDGENAVAVTEQFCDAEYADHACDNDEGACCDSVSDSVSFEFSTDEVDGVGQELPESQSDSMLCRLPIKLDVVQELSDSGSEDVVTEKSAVIDPLALSPATASPTSPSSVFDHIVPDHRSPDSSSKPPTGAVVLRKSSKSDSAEKSPLSPEYAVVQGQKVELRPSRMTTATKRVSSFRKSLIK